MLDRHKGPCGSQSCTAPCTVYRSCWPAASHEHCLAPKAIARITCWPVCPERAISSIDNGTLHRAHSTSPVHADRLRRVQTVARQSRAPTAPLACAFSATHRQQVRAPVLEAPCFAQLPKRSGLRGALAPPLCHQPPPAPAFGLWLRRRAARGRAEVGPELEMAQRRARSQAAKAIQEGPAAQEQNRTASPIVSGA